MSMMILSIGVLCLASLFPIGIMSAARATHLTNAVTLKQNATAQIRINPGLVLDPDRDLSPMFGTKSNYIIDPLVFIPLQPNAAVPLTIKVFDEDTNNNFRMDAGEDVNRNNKLDSLYRWHAGYNTRVKAELLATLPDSWTELAASAPETLPTATRVQLNSPVDLIAASQIAPTTRMRVLLLDPTNAQSHIAEVLATGITPQNRQLSWSPLRPLPLTNRTAITDVRLEHQEIKYSYLLTVRRQLDEDRNGDLVLSPGEDINSNGFLDRGNGSASVDVVVYHRREFNLAAEKPLYSSSGFVKNRNAVMVTVPKGLSYKKGGYLLDATNLRWYRIESAQIASSTSTGANVLFTLQQPIIEDAPPSLNGVILSSHVVQVFHLGGI
jgi:hypothetical protein